MLVVIGRRLAEGDQISGRGDLVRVVRLSRATAVFGLGGLDDGQEEDHCCIRSKSG